MAPFPLSRPVKDAIAPPIPRAQAWAASYNPTHGKPLLNLSQGVPGDPPHPLLRESLGRAAGDLKGVGYGPILGDEVLRRAVQGEMGFVYGFGEGRALGGGGGGEVLVGEEGTVTAIDQEQQEQQGGPPTWEEVAITSGCNQAFFEVMMGVCERGAGVVLPVPWYFNMLMTFQILGITPLPLPLDATTGFLPSIAATTALLDSEQGKSAKAIVLVTPNNPTGTTYPPKLIEVFADLARDRGIALVVDETYRDFIVPDSETGNGSSGPGRPHTLFERPDWRDHVISVASFSKSYKIPGHRLGMIVAGKEVLKAVTTVADCIQICAPRPPQIALAPLLPSLRTDLAETSARIHARLELFTDLITPIRGWRVVSKGGFYAYVQHPYVDPTGAAVPSEKVSELLATRCGILTLPGAFFMPERDTPGWESLVQARSALVEDKWIRFAIANVSDDVVRGVPERLEMLNEIMQGELGCRIEQ